MNTKTPATPFATLTWDDIETWAGSRIVSRGKSYQRSNRVRELARTVSGGVIAWVQGTSRYATRVEIAKKKLTASCTCPYGGTCKHAVATVLSYLECLKLQQEIPAAAQDDSRFDRLKEAAEAAAAVRTWEPQEDEEDYDEEENDEDNSDEDNEEEDDEEDEEPTTRPRGLVKRTQSPPSDGATTYLEQQSKEDLIALLKELMRQHPDVRQAIVDRANLLSGEVKKLVATARKEINALARMPAWGDEDDRGRGSSGNYSRIRT